jgi:riboflavin synthase
MFSGIVQEIGEVVALEREGEQVRLHVRAPRTAPRLAIGDSVAVDGVCLTATNLDGEVFTAGLAPETLRRTNLGTLRPGARVNLEPARRAGDPMGGHYVQGHVDGVGTIVADTPEGDSRRLRFRAPPELLRYVVVKGFIAVDGISLTVTECDDESFGVALIAHTQEVTTLGEKTVGDTVNLEVDVVAKYVERLIAPHLERLAAAVRMG